MSYYLFPEPGTLPGGIPGTFAGVRVDVDDETGKYTVSPLSQHPHYEPAQDEGASSPVPPQEAVPETPIEHLQELEQEVQQAIDQVEHPDNNEPSPPAQAEV